VTVHIGTSGWSYGHWTNVLYPEGLPPERRLDHYVRQFQTAELNASYYRWPSDSAFASWQRRLPGGFIFTVKAPGALTHVKRLYRPEAWLARITQGLDRLGSRRGVLLVQLPPTAPVADFQPLHPMEWHGSSRMGPVPACVLLRICSFWRSLGAWHPGLG
jgi:uncharacterized protein YecE (DUF72 family)